MNRSSKIILSLVLAIYGFIGLAHSYHQGFWHDEIYTLTFLQGVSVYDFEGSVWSEVDVLFDASFCKKVLSQDNFISNFPVQILHEGHPPLYFIILKGWSTIFGTTEVGLRSFSLLCGILTFVVLFGLFYKETKRKYVAWFLLAMLVFNPFLFYFFTEARMYSLALLFASLSFKFWISYTKERKINSMSFLFFSLSSICLLYTHYYGAFFLSTLVLFELIKYGFHKSMFNHLIALICFLPWGVVIKKQLAFHNVHWTDGALTFIDSVKAFVTGIFHLIISPMSKPLFFELVITSSILVVIMGLSLTINWKKLGIGVGVIFAYFLQIYMFDQIVDHHSIMVPRYYVFVLIFIYWFLFKLMNAKFRLPMFFVFALYFGMSANVLFQIYNLERAPKQMLREVAGFVDNRHGVENRTLVLEPKGPLAFGLSYYLNKNFDLMHAENGKIEVDANAVYIDQMLGDTNVENRLDNEVQNNLELVPFAGVFLYQ
ncbi:MAG: putative membrane protein [Arcticibacterium sp.]|jgi:uncharacterized membrane protein